MCAAVVRPAVGAVMMNNVIIAMVPVLILYIVLVIAIVLVLKFFILFF